MVWREDWTLTWVCSVENLCMFPTVSCDDGDVRLSIDNEPPESYELIDDELARGRVEVCDGDVRLSIDNDQPESY